MWPVGIKEDKSCKLDCPVRHETLFAMPASLHGKSQSTEDIYKDSKSQITLSLSFMLTCKLTDDLFFHFGVEVGFCCRVKTMFNVSAQSFES